MQIIAPECHVRLSLTDLRLPPAEREAEALRLAVEMRDKPFDLAQAPLLRGRVVRIAEDDHRLYLDAASHHLRRRLDLSVVVPELAAIYDGLCGRPRTAPCPPEPAIRRLRRGWRERLASGAVDKQIDYWRQRLADELPVLRLPTRPAAARRCSAIAARWRHFPCSVAR